MAAGIARPDVYTAIALNRDPGDPTTPSVWTPLESSTLQLAVASGLERGRDYELAQPMASDPTLLVRDVNEYLNPDNASSPYAGQVRPYREIAQVCQWPITGAGSTGNLINSDTWRGSRVDAFDPTFDSYTAGNPAPNWLERLGTTAAVISTTTPRSGANSVRYAVTTPSMGVGFGVPVIPGRQYTTSLYVRQSVANTQRIYLAGTAAGYDPFNRTSSSSWGTPPVGAAYAVSGTAAEYNVTPGAGTMTLAGTVTPRTATQGTFAQAVQYATVTAPVLATGASYVEGTVVRFTSTSNYYRAGVEFKTDGSIGVLIEKVVATVTSTVATLATTLTYAAGDQFQLAFTLTTDKFLEAHVWPAAKRESLTFSTGYVADTSLTADGAVGCFAYRASGNTNTNLPATFVSYRATGTVGGTSTTTTGSYQRLSITYTADTFGRPALADDITLPDGLVIGVAGLWCYVATTGTVSADNVNVDDIQHEQAASASTFTTTGPVIYPGFRNLAERYPRGWRSQGYEGFTAIPCVDALAALNKIRIPDEVALAILLTQPDFYYPLNDGTETGRWLDQSGNNQVPLVPFVSKYGAGTALEPGTAFPLTGKPGAAGVAITATVGGALGARPGTALALDQQLPPVSPPASGWAMSFACWAVLDLNANAGDSEATLFSVSNLLNNNVVQPWFSLRMDTATQAVFDINLPVAGTSASLTITSPFGDGRAHHYACMIKQDATNTTWTLWVDGVSDTGTFATSTLGMLSTPGRTVTLGVDTAGLVGSFMNGVLAQAAIWNRAITDSEIQAMFGAGAFGADGELSGARILRHVQQGGYYGPTRISQNFNSTAMGVPSFDGSIDLLTDTLNTTQAEMGTLWVQPDGVLAFETRQDRWLRLTPVAVFGENAAAGEIPYQAGILFDHDPTYVYPVVTWTRNGGATALGGLPADRLAAARAFFPRQFDGSNDLFEDATAQYLADWIFYGHRDTLTRVDEIEIDPWAAEGTPYSLWAKVLRLETGQRVTVVRRASAANAGAGLTMSADYFIEKIGTPEQNFTDDGQAWTLRFQLSPIGAGNAPAGPTAQPWILEDATYGVLDHTTVLGW